MRRGERAQAYSSKRRVRHSLIVERHCEGQQFWGWRWGNMLVGRDLHFAWGWQERTVTLVALGLLPSRAPAL